MNALSWTSDGQTLLSGGDDRTVRFWRMNNSDITRDYSFECTAVLHTGHTANIFNAHMLPHSTKLATVAGDSEVRVFDIGSHVPTSIFGGETVYRHRTAMKRLLNCHHDRTKRIVTEDSPDVFLTVAEDGSVRQHDLRTTHRCSVDECPAPLIKMKHELTSLSLSPLTPYQFVVAGESPFGYLFDRRQLGRRMEEEWGHPFQSDGDNLATCVRRFVKPDEHRYRHREHVTGVRISPYNGHEVLMSYSGDAVYLFSTLDNAEEPETLFAKSTSRPPSPKHKSPTPPPRYEETEEEAPREDLFDENGMIDTMRLLETEGTEEGDDAECEMEIDDDTTTGNPLLTSPKYHPGVPCILPRRRYVGACNVETVKDVNFLGPRDEWIVSGSDEGYWFMWDKDDGHLHGIYEGDGSVVNVIESHPHLPLVAVSGIDTTVKLFAPTRGESSFSRLSEVQGIVEENTRRNKESHERNYGGQVLLTRLFRLAALQHAAEGRPQCTHQ